MKLSQLLPVLQRADLLVTAPAQDVDVARLEVDSRCVDAGALFLALRGAIADGNRFVAQAVANGAAAVLTETPIALDIPVVVVRDAKRATRLLAQRWYDNPADELSIVGITGTNGKTTTTAMMRHLLDRDGDAGSIGTLGAFDGRGEKVESSAGSLTTPGPLDLQATFRALVDRGVRQVAMETSSHALDQGRLDGITFAAGIFTNLTREHLDYHLTMEQYLGAKLRLADLVGPAGVLAVNADDVAWQALHRDRRTISWGTDPSADVHVAGAIYRAAGTRFTLSGRFGTREVSIPFLGEFNVANAVGAATVALGLGRPIDEVVARLDSAPQVPGRMERLAERPCTVLRDYAHTPDAFERVLSMLRPLTPGTLTILFGCGGDRDAGKRPIMGRIAAQLADHVVLTTDNPRTEDPERIIDDIVAEMPARSYRRILDREAAIATLIGEGHAGDTILLAGKGHETYQIEGKTYRHFDERAIVRRLTGQ